MIVIKDNSIAYKKIVETFGQRDSYDQIIDNLIDIGITAYSMVEASKSETYIKSMFETLLNNIDNSIIIFQNNLINSIENIIKNNFDIADSSSIMNKINYWLFKGVEDILNSTKEITNNTITEVKNLSDDKLKLIDDKITITANFFNPDNTNSYLYKFNTVINDTQEKIESLLDFSNTNSFAYKLTSLIEDYFGNDSPILSSVEKILEKQINTFSNEIISLREEISKREGMLSILEKSVSKGTIFENEIENLLNNYSKITSDIITNVSNISNYSDKKGDFIFEIPSLQNEKIVIEVKDVSNLHLKGILDYLNLAMQNRGCNYAILCVKDENQLPSSSTIFSLYEGNKLFCTYDTLIPAINFFKLYIAKINYTDKNSSSINTTSIENSLESIINSVKNFRNIKYKLTSLKKAVDSNYEEINQILDDINAKIKKDITTILGELSNDN